MKTAHILAAVMLLSIPLAAQAQIIPLSASRDIWIREISPDSTLENDLISVWSSGSSDGGRRYGLIEFDLSGLAGQTIEAATLDLFSLTGGSQAGALMKQSAYIIDSSGTALGSLSWNSYMAEKDAGKVALEGLGRYDLGPISDDPLLQDAYVQSVATLADLALIQAEIDGDGILSLVLIADEGDDYRRDWGDGANAGGPGYQDDTPAVLTLVVPEPASLGLLAVGLGLMRRRNGLAR